MPQKYSKEIKILRENEKRIKKDFAHIIEPLLTLHDCQIDLFNNHVWIIQDPCFDLSNYLKILIQSYINNSQLLFSAFHLTSLGNHSAASILLRKIFEFQLIGKFASLNKKSGVLNKWLDGRQVDIYKTVIKQIKNPANGNIHEFWKSLCTPVHATTFGSQVGYKYEENVEKIELTLIIIFILNNTNYHLLNSHLIDRRMIYYSEQYGNKRYENKNLKKRAKKAISFSKEHFISHSGRKLIYDYSRKWELNKK